MTSKMTSKPLFVGISDLHFNLQNLRVATQCLYKAINVAEQLQIPLVIAGDTNDTKGSLRAEIVNCLIEILSSTKILVYVIVGNHDLINEKGEEHSLNFLKPYAVVIDEPKWDHYSNFFMIPYQSDKDKLVEILKTVPNDIITVMHQGFLGAHMGEYIKDTSSIDTARVAHLKVFSGHYHTHQTIGTITYFGTAYTTSFSEASDPKKGFLVVNSDGSYDKVYTKVRKHIITDLQVDEIDFTALQVSSVESFSINLVKLRLYGPKEKLNVLDIKLLHQLTSNPAMLKIEKIYSEVKIPAEISLNTKSVATKFDDLIDNAYPKTADVLKTTWKSVAYED